MLVAYPMQGRGPPPAIFPQLQCAMLCPQALKMEASTVQTDADAMSTGPDSPYAILTDWPHAALRTLIEGIQMRLAALGSSPPQGAGPKSAKSAAEMQAKLDGLLQEGSLHQAYPLLCQMALYRLDTQGAEDPATLRAIYNLLVQFNMYTASCPELLEYLLPRAAKQWGIGHADTRKLTVLGAQFLCTSPDPRRHVNLTRTVSNIVRALPGGLGWGAASTAPVPDEDAYNRHAVMMEQALQAYKRGERKLAAEMYDRCVKYYRTLGAHWLGSPRKARAAEMRARCLMLDDAETLDWTASEAVITEAKRDAIRELGSTNVFTVPTIQLHAQLLMLMQQKEKAMSMFRKALALRKEVFGVGHIHTLGCQVRGQTKFRVQHVRMHACSHIQGSHACSHVPSYTQVLCGIVMHAIMCMLFAQFLDARACAHVSMTCELVQRPPAASMHDAYICMLAAKGLYGRRASSLHGTNKQLKAVCSLLVPLQAEFSRVLVSTDRYDEAVEMLRDAFYTHVNSFGPTSRNVSITLQQYWKLLLQRGRRSEAAQLLQRAAQLGCDISHCQPGVAI